MEEKFIQWSQLIMCGEIKPNEKIVLMVILNCNNMAWPYIAHSEIMKQSGLKETSVKEAIKTLRKMGLITKVKTDINNMNNYIACGVNLASLITSGSDFDPLNTKETTSGSQNNPQVGRKTPDIYNINKKENNKEKKVKRKEMNTGKQTTKCESNKPSVNFKGLDLKLNSHSAERCDSSNVPTVTEAVANNEQCSMDCGYIPIEDLEGIYNGGQTIPTKPSKQAPTNKFTPREEWNKAMENIKSKVETDTKLNQTDLQMLLEGANDTYRVIDTLKTLKMLMRNYVRLACYHIFLNDCDATITTIQSEKQRKYADEILKECDKYYEHYRKTFKKSV